MLCYVPCVIKMYCYALPILSFPLFLLQISSVFVPLQTTGLTAVWTTFWSVPSTCRFTQRSSPTTPPVRPAIPSLLTTCSAPAHPKTRQWYELTGYWGHCVFLALLAASLYVCQSVDSERFSLHVLKQVRSRHIMFNGHFLMQMIKM